MWQNWYSDGSIYNSEDGPPETAPGYCLQVIAQPDRTSGTGNVGYVTLKKYDWYMWHLESEEWFGVMGDSSMHTQLLTRQPVIAICQGLMIPQERFDAILAEAEEWAASHGLPSKSGFRPEEN